MIPNCVNFQIERIKKNEKKRYRERDGEKESRNIQLFIILLQQRVIFLFFSFFSLQHPKERKITETTSHYLCYLHENVITNLNKNNRPSNKRHTQILAYHNN